MSFRTFQAKLRNTAELIETRLLDEIAAFPMSVLAEAMAHAATGGKRMRGFLAMESARIAGMPADRAIWPALAVEAMHAYSLVHDDLPCMDDSELRRGRPATHVKWNETIAVLAGDALQALAFELASRPQTGPDAVRVELGQSLARAVGAQGLVLGQTLDLLVESADEPPTERRVIDLQAAKTGALIEWAACVGPRLASVDPTPMAKYAQAIGLAFQIVDDILDAEGDTRITGKPVRRDACAGKATFVALLGLENARNRATELAEQACDTLAEYGARADLLRQAARFAIVRDR